MNTQPKSKGKFRHSSESGYTILEGVMAMVVVSVLMLAVSPVIVLATGIRMQAKRIQLASQAASSYVAYIKTSPRRENAPGNLENPLEEPTDDDPLPTHEAPQLNFDIDGLCEQNGEYCGDNNQLYCVDFDGDDSCTTDSQVDMIVQPIARLYNSIAPDDESNQWADDGYVLAVRVYRANAFGGDQPLTNGSEDEGGVDTSITNAIGRRNFPLINLQTSVEPTGDLFQKYSNTLQDPNP